MAYITAVVMNSGGVAILWRRSARAGAAALAIIYFIYHLLVASTLYGASLSWVSNSCLYRRVGRSGHGTHRVRSRSAHPHVSGNAQFIMATVAANDSDHPLDIWTLLNRIRRKPFDEY
jgi:hypothetical protein